MTRQLTDLLQAPEAHFRLQLRELERSSGHQNIDITLSVEVMHAAQAKIRRLGLDHLDTTPEEFYHALQSRLTADDKRLERALRTRAAQYVSAEADLMVGLVHALREQAAGQSTFAIKGAAIKRMLKIAAPKRLQKALGYRSLDAMVRAETPALLVTIASVIESAAWRRSWNDQYRKLQPHDFENQAVKVLSPSGARWQKLASKITEQEAHTVLNLPELGTVVVLPLPAQHPAGMVIATTALALHELNAMAAVSTYIKAAQVHGDFGIRLQAAVRGDLQLQAPQFSESMSWHLVQQYFARRHATIHEDVFGPYVQAADFTWHNVEQSLSKLCPTLEFWEQSSFTSFLQAGRSVSCNVLDVALNCCNKVAYEARSIEHAQQALWGELTLRYLDHQSIESAVASVLQPQLATEMALA